MTIDLDGFRGAVAEAAGLPLDEVTPDARLVEDLGLDSLRMLVLLAALADLGVPEPEGVTLAAGTVAEAFEQAAAAPEAL